MKKSILAAALALATTPMFGQAVSMPVVPPVQAYEKLKQFLTLSDAQVNSLKQILDTRRSAERAIYEQISTRQTELNKLLAAGSNDAANIGRLMVEINNLRRQLPTSGTPYRNQALSVLNDVQKAKLPQLVQALELQSTAGEAVYLNLIDYPRVPEPRILPAAAELLSATVVNEP